MSQESAAQGQAGQTSAPHPVHSANEPPAPAFGTANGAERQAPVATKKQQGGKEQKKAAKKADDGLSRNMAALEVCCCLLSIRVVELTRNCHVQAGSQARVHPTAYRAL